SQVPHQVRQCSCDLLELEPHRVRVVAPDVGGGFGAKLIVYPEDVLIPFLALRFGRPVRWLEDRLEHMLTATQERTQVHTVDVGFDAEGRLLALRDRFVHDTGAYTPRGLVVPLLSASMLAGPYRIPDVEVSFDSVYYPAVLRRALEMADYERLAKECLRARREGRLLGLGVACYVELTGVGPFEGATIRADAAGRITVFTGVPSQGQGLETTLA